MPEAKPVAQIKRRLIGKRRKILQEETYKLLKENFTGEDEYTTR